MKGWSAKQRATTKGSGDADRAFRPGPPKCKCGRRHVARAGSLCALCKREKKAAGVKITAKQRVARKKNIVIARMSKRK